MKMVGKSKTEFEPVLVGATTTTGAGLIVPKSAMPEVILAEPARPPLAGRPWLTVEELYAQVREGSRLSRGKFKAQLAKMINRGLVEVQYPSKEAHSYGAQKRVRVSAFGQNEAVALVEGKADGAPDQPAAAELDQPAAAA